MTSSNMTLRLRDFVFDCIEDLRFYYEEKLSIENKDNKLQDHLNSVLIEEIEEKLPDLALSFRALIKLSVSTSSIIEKAIDSFNENDISKVNKILKENMLYEHVTDYNSKTPRLLLRKDLVNKVEDIRYKLSEEDGIFLKPRVIYSVIILIHYDKIFKGEL